jgi:hypothetical protein
MNAMYSAISSHLLGNMLPGRLGKGRPAPSTLQYPHRAADHGRSGAGNLADLDADPAPEARAAAGQAGGLLSAGRGFFLVRQAPRWLPLYRLPGAAVGAQGE